MGLKLIGLKKKYLLNKIETSKQALRPITPHAILSTKLVTLQKLLQETNANEICLDALQECLALATPLDSYIAQHSTSPSEALDELEINTNAIDWDSAYEKGETELRLEKEMVSGAVEGQFLKLLTAISGAQRILEIGSFTGYASLAMAEALPKNGKLVALEYDQFAADFAQKQWQKSEHGHKIEVRVGDAQMTLQQLATEGAVFDLVFLDADKQNYTNYYEVVLEQELVKIGGLICVDNTLYMGQAYGAGNVTENGKALQSFNHFVREDVSVQQVLLPLRDGLTIIRRVK